MNCFELWWRYIEERMEINNGEGYWVGNLMEKNEKYKYEGIWDWFKKLVILFKVYYKLIYFI